MMLLSDFLACFRCFPKSLASAFVRLRHMPIFRTVNAERTGKCCHSRAISTGATSWNLLPEIPYTYRIASKKPFAWICLQSMWLSMSILYQLCDVWIFLTDLDIFRSHEDIIDQFDLRNGLPAWFPTDSASETVEIYGLQPNRSYEAHSRQVGDRGTQIAQIAVMFRCTWVLCTANATPAYTFHPSSSLYCSKAFRTS